MCDAVLHYWSSSPMSIHRIRLWFLKRQRNCLKPLLLESIRPSMSRQVFEQPFPVIPAIHLSTRSATIRPPCRVLLSVVNHSRLRRLIIEGIWPGSHHASHPNHARTSIGRRCSWILGVCNHGRKRVGIIIIHHTVDFLGDRTLRGTVLPTGLSIRGRYWVNWPRCCVSHRLRHRNPSRNKSGRRCIRLHIGAHSLRIIVSLLRRHHMHRLGVETGL